MNWVDFILALALVLFALEGWGKPLAYEIYNLGSFLVAFVVSLKVYNLAAGVLESQFSLPHSFANALGFIIVWYLIEIALYALARLFFAGLKSFSVIPGEGYISIIPAFLRGLVFTAIMLVLVATFPIQPKVKAAVNSSLIGSYILGQTYQLEAPLKSIFGGLANDTLAFLTIQPKSSESVSLGFKQDKFTYDEKAENAMLVLVNKERTSRGLTALAKDSQLSTVARNHSADMFRQGYFSHYSPQGLDVSDRAEQSGIEYQLIGENLAFAPSLELAHQGLMNSPGHRANILNPQYRKIGIGAANAGDYGLMFTQVFKD